MHMYLHERMHTYRLTSLHVPPTAAHVQRDWWAFPPGQLLPVLQPPVQHADHPDHYGQVLIKSAAKRAPARHFAARFTGVWRTPHIAAA